jgi:hypothetical protein
MWRRCTINLQEDRAHGALKWARVLGWFVRHSASVNSLSLAGFEEDDNELHDFPRSAVCTFLGSPDSGRQTDRQRRRVHESPESGEYRWPACVSAASMAWLSFRLCGKTSAN